MLLRVFQALSTGGTEVRWEQRWACTWPGIIGLDQGPLNSLSFQVKFCKYPALAFKFFAGHMGFTSKF